MTVPDDETSPVGALLALETAGSACSAAVVRDGRVVAAERRPLRHGHVEALLPMVGRVMDGAGLLPAQLAAVAAAVGPGGFTGIRAGLAAAHGIALAAGARLVGVSAFAAVAAAVAASGGFDDCAALLVALDSRREDLYLQLFALAAGADAAAAPLAAPQAVLPRHLADYAAGAPDGAPLLIAGDAAAAAAIVLAERRPCVIAADSAPDARGVAAAALRRLQVEASSTTARPLYLRPPDVTLPRRRPATASAGR